MFVEWNTFRVFLLALLFSPAMAQGGAQERVARLRAQLADVQAQQTDLQTRLDQIDEDIKPENIERSLAGIGSMHPEDLREARRRQLDIQRKGIQSQLDSLTATRTRLENAIASAEAESYRTGVSSGMSSLSNAKTPVRKKSRPQQRRAQRRGRRTNIRVQ
jgi:peptidoglycan hydrolase CwlO-like protein